MSRTFEVTIDSAPAELMSKAKKVAQEHGATILGDNYSGALSASGVEGGYEVIGSTVFITITKKPFFVPWGTVEKKVMDFFHTRCV